jgi:hypothetical protein
MIIFPNPHLHHPHLNPVLRVETDKKNKDNKSAFEMCLLCYGHVLFLYLPSSLFLIAWKSSLAETCCSFSSLSIAAFLQLRSSIINFQRGGSPQGYNFTPFLFHFLFPFQCGNIFRGDFSSRFFKTSFGLIFVRRFFKELSNALLFVR